MYWVTFIESGLETIPGDDEFEIIEAAEDEVDSVSFMSLKKAFVKFLKSGMASARFFLLAKSVVLQPSDKSLWSKEIPIDTFFHKIVMLRDRLFVMEHKTNASKDLGELEKINQRQYITRCYGSLNTLNVLFKGNSQQFKGEISGK